MCTHLHPSSRTGLPEPVERPPVEVPEHGHALAATADHRLWGSLQLASDYKTTKYLQGELLVKYYVWQYSGVRG